MKRLHVHISVDNLAESIRFYSAMFASQPTVNKPDYAKWMLDDPRVNFAISQRGAAMGLNHLGIQIESADELAEMHQRLQTLQESVVEEAGAACCYAKSDKYWVNDPQGIAWETFHTLDSIPMFGEPQATASQEAACCIPLVQTSSTSACCVPTGQRTTNGSCC
ncbi:catechol 2,3-dioxygenase-like lactoylglutathione lyase family enzyme [Chitinivorax tropicus]|uniref:Catechol 2,3-dioxygenase-like lactoylglutathione lyase family enzyme n=1 Tax=Chitinivorax tropicus TaxID=714531 RepID=A0A840MNG0_9PROT|nr:ArsI/CadI family heavy metal resistance metalloenzyme [Chitinivorax tropicus]MBB5018046.1 catechol 2,3-dioxygenase-like lactoylglutathione lyase family enzyme [Chitinivorax tropicus]